MKRLFKWFKSWLNADDISGELGANILISFIRYSFVVVCVLTSIVVTTLRIFNW